MTLPMGANMKDAKYDSSDNSANAWGAGSDREMEQLLGGLTPVRPTLDASAILAEAARRNQAALCAARRQVWLWRAVAGAVAASLALVIWTERSAKPADRSGNPIIHIDSMPTTGSTATNEESHQSPAPPSLAPLPPLPTCAYLVLRQQVLTRGLEALHDPPGVSDPRAPGETDSALGKLRTNGGG